MAKKVETRKKSEEKTEQENFSGKALLQPVFLVLAGVLLGLLCWSYSNHFDNPFHFDDSHTIVNNTAIRDLGNFSKFLTDATTFSTLPANQAWRPGVTVLNAIDTHFSKDHIPDPHVFHISIFASYIVLGFLLFFFCLHIFRKAFPQIKYGHWAALLATGFFMLHTANAETINYIISRDDSFSTLMILAAFDLYFYFRIARKYFLFLIAVFIGFLMKEPAVMFGPILLIYIWLFGEPDKNKKAVTWQIILSFAFAFILFLLSKSMTPEHWKAVSEDEHWYQYLASEAFVMVHYVYNFILPVNLSADTDWTLLTNYFDDRFFIGIVFVATLLLIAWKCSKQQNTKPISFGICWFFIALIPSSTIFPLAEVLNDHRTFFPYIGLVIAAVTCGVLCFEKMKALGKIEIAKPLFIFISTFILVAHAFGTHHRNEVWHTEKTLWKDVTEKSPNNGRGWMNYGLNLMNDSVPDLPGTIDCFTKALSLAPNYSYANTNMGIALSKLNRNAEAEPYYTKAISVDPYNPECYYYYAIFLLKMDRIKEAKDYLQKGFAISPSHDGINKMLNSLGNANYMSALDYARDQVKQNPNADNYVNLSLELYKDTLFLESAHAAEQAVKLKPDYAVAYNNICAAYNKIGEFDLAQAAGEKAVELNPKDQLTIGNYSYAHNSKVKFDKLESDAKQNPTDVAWLGLSVQWYGVSNFKKSMIAAQEATLLNPKNATAWNNICACANQIQDWDTAIIAGEKALKLDPTFELAKNNLAVAEKGKAGGK